MDASQGGKSKKQAKRVNGRCSVCGRRVRMNFDKTVRDHFRDNLNTENLCLGSNKPPTQELRRERVTRR